MRKFFFLAVSILVVDGAAGQEDPASRSWAASITGAILPLPEINIGIQPGLYYRFSERFSLITEMTIRTGKKADKDSEAVDKQYFRVQPEIRYHFKTKKSKRDMYTGLRLSYAIRKFADINSGFYATEKPGGDKGFYYDKAKISSPVFTSSVQTGVLLTGKKKFSADIFAGIGARFIKTRYTDQVNPAPGTRSRPSGTPVFYASYDYNGSAVWLQVNAGFRLLYHFGK